MMTLNFDVFKEPKGFIKILQLLFVIIALASICSFAGVVEVELNVNNVTQKTEFPINYPFNNYNSKFKEILTKLNLSDFSPFGNFESSTHFAVFVSVISMLYCVAALFIYIAFDDFIYQDPKIRKTDFVIEAVLSLLWIVVSIAWSDITVKLKSELTDLCKNSVKINSNAKCSTHSTMGFGGAYVGIIASFTTFALMLCGLWFLWKETGWSKQPHLQDTYNPRDDDTPDSS